VAWVEESTEVCRVKNASRIANFLDQSVSAI